MPDDELREREGKLLSQRKTSLGPTRIYLWLDLYFSYR